MRCSEPLRGKDELKIMKYEVMLELVATRGRSACLVRRFQ
jgi:hypothetical protein